MAKTKRKQIIPRHLIVQDMRRRWRNSPERKQAIKNARVPDVKPFHVYCARCRVIRKENESPKGYQVDHIVPVGSHTQRLDLIALKLFVPSSQLQVLCKVCHYHKTKHDLKEE